jgi:hypothetical protein
LKEAIDITISGTQYSLYLTIGDLRHIEREVGRSILSIMGDGVGQLVASCNLDVLVSMLRWGIHDKLHGKRNDDQVYDLLQAYCDDGNSIDDMTANFIGAILQTGLYTRVRVPGKNVKTETKKKAASSSAPRKNG